MFFSVYTLGCKLNQLETEAITDSFCRAGFSFFPWGHIPSVPGPMQPSLMIINTCTVTSMADQKARRLIRKTLREHPAACLIVTGCYAQMEKDALAELEDNPGRLFVIPGENKDRILDLPAFLAGITHALPAELRSSDLSHLISTWLASFSLYKGEDESKGKDGSFRFTPENFTSHSRGFLKIQDGCDHRCTYCRVSLARGKSRSLGAKEVLEALRSLETRGFAEAVLTGVNITQYRDGSMTLAGLLEFLLSKTKTIRLRLSSIEPDGLEPEKFTGEFIHAVTNHRIRPHFHLSLQSGSGEILTKMGRPYSPEDIERTLTLLRSVRDDPFLACDIITGFPGETGAEFEKTFSLCQRAGFAWIHAFPFSPRPGTAAYDLPGKPDERDARQRVESLTELARKGRREYLGRWEGREVEAIVETGKGLAKGFVPGLSENYLKLLVSCSGEEVPRPGASVHCRIGKPIIGGEPSWITHFDAQAELV